MAEIQELEQRLGLPDHLQPSPNDDADFRQMEANVEALEALTRHPGWALLEDAVKADTAKLQRRVLLGQCKTWEEYLKATGKIAGMLDVFDLPKSQRDNLNVRRDA